MAKRILSLVLALMMVLGTIVAVSAADEKKYAEENAWAVMILDDIDVLQGISADDLGLDVAIKRYEMSLFITRALTGKTADSYWTGAKNETPFLDLEGFLYAGALTWTYNFEIILGRDGTTFDPNGHITYQEAIAMIVRAWEHYYNVDLDIKTTEYPWRHIELADYLGLTQYIDETTEYTEVLSRGAVAQLIYNLLVFDMDTVPAGDTNSYGSYLDEYKNATEDILSIGEAVFGLKDSMEGVIASVVSVSDKGVVTLDPAIPDVNKTDFADNGLDAEVGEYYLIKYYTRYATTKNAFTGKPTIDRSKSETTVVSIEQVSNEASATNTPASQEFSFVYEATAWKDNDKNKDATEWKITHVIVNGTKYELAKLPVYVNSKDDANLLGTYNGALGNSALTGLTSNKVNAYALDYLYATINLVDDGKAAGYDYAILTPYVFASVYAEQETAKTDDGKTTEFVFAGYSVVPAKNCEEITNGTTVRFITKDKDGKANAAQDVTVNTAYVAKSTVKPLATATVHEKVILEAYDVRPAVNAADRYIKVAGTKYTSTYTALNGWDVNGDYVTMVDDSAALRDLYHNAIVADDKLNGAKKYVNVYVIDGNIVAFTYADGTTSGGGTTTPTPTAKYAGVLDIDNAIGNYVNGYSTAKLVNGKYYAEVTLNVNGASKKVLVYLADAKTFVLDTASGKTYQEQYDAWLSAENTKIATAVSKIGTGLFFYTLDANGNIVVTLNVAVNAETYKKHVGGANLLTPSKDKTITNVTYAMDYGFEDYVKYSEDAGATYKYYTALDTEAYEWLFIDVAAQTLATFNGAPEFGSEVSVSDNDLIKNGSTLVAFTTAKTGFQYSMFQDAHYVIYTSGVGADASLDVGIRDGNYYYNVVNLFSAKAELIKTPEESQFAKSFTELNKTEGLKRIVAVNDENEVLAVYEVTDASIKAIESMTHGSTSFSFTASGVTTETIVNNIKMVYSLGTVATAEMSANKANIVYTLNGTDVVKVDGTNVTLPTGNANVYVFYSAPTATAAASYIAFVIGA